MHTDEVDRKMIIAEIAQGFGGDVGWASMFVEAASSAGANAIKFQVIYADEIASRNYQHYGLFKSLEMDEAAWVNIGNVSRERNLIPIFDVFGEQSLGVAIAAKSEIMVHATDCVNLPLLKRINESVKNGSRIYVGVGGRDVSEIESAILALGDHEVVLMVGHQGYPTPRSDLPISRLKELQDKYSDTTKISVGYADHSAGGLLESLSSTAVAIAAAEIGIIEKHLTMADCMMLEDYESALSPDEFKLFATEVSLLLDNKINRLENRFSESEVRYRSVVSRIAVAKEDLMAGDIATWETVELLRAGIADPNEVFDIRGTIERLIGLEITKNIRKGEAIVKSAVNIGQM